MSEQPLRLEWRSPHELAEHPRNWKSHPPHQLASLTEIMSQVGWAGACLYNEATGKLLDGHARRKLAVEQGCDRVPVLIGSWTEEQERKILLTLDPIASLAEHDSAMLASLLADTPVEGPSLKALLESLAPPAPVPDVSDAGGGGDGFDAAPEEGPTRTSLGELWLIGGRHRLLVGDCTLAENVARLMGDGQAECVCTDPPYGVAIGDKNRFLNSIARSNRVEENLTNDTLDESSLAAMLDAAFGLAVSFCRPGAAWYVAAPAGPLHLVFAAAMKSRGILRQMIIWVKNNATFSPLGVSYHWRHEPIFYGWLPNAGHRYYGDRKQDTVWEVDRPQASPDHPTTKPIELMARALRDSTMSGDLVYDPFLGSGTTLIAASRLGRTCYGCEIDPKYADVVLKRCEAEGMSVERAA